MRVWVSRVEEKRRRIRAWRVEREDLDGMSGVVIDVAGTVGVVRRVL